MTSIRTAFRLTPTEQTRRLPPDFHGASLMSETDPLLDSLKAALAAVQVIGPDDDDRVWVAVTAHGVTATTLVGVAGDDPTATVWLAWRDGLA